MILIKMLIFVQKDKYQTKLENTKKEKEQFTGPTTVNNAQLKKNAVANTELEQ